jgi:hypothetical protein
MSDKATEIEALVGQIEKTGSESDILEESVHEAAAEQASLTNNAGLHAQLEFLIDCWGLADVKNLITELLDEDEDEKPIAEVPVQRFGDIITDNTNNEESSP